MTTINFSTVAESIANIDYSAKGIHAKGAGEIPVNGITECPYFAPRQPNFLTDIQFSREAFGSGGSEPMNLIYTMHWSYFHAPIGTVLTFQEYGDLLDNLAYIMQQIADNDAITGAVDLKPLNIDTVGGIKDLADNSYHGVEIALQVTEFIK